MAIHFGTDGWRGVISDTFTFSSLRQVTQAIADAVASDEWLNSHGQAPADPRRMVVGFDTRFLSDRYAVEAARVLAANGYRVSLTTADIPTPVLSFAARGLGAIAGLMITAEGPKLIGDADQERRIRPALGGHVPKLEAGPWRAFPADLMSIAIVVATQCDGLLLVFEKLFESRTRYGVSARTGPEPGCPISAEEMPLIEDACGGGDKLSVTRDELVALVEEALKARSPA